MIEKASTRVGFDFKELMFEENARKKMQAGVK